MRSLMRSVGITPDVRLFVGSSSAVEQSSLPLAVLTV
jgi:hypothetical protein